MSTTPTVSPKGTPDYGRLGRLGRLCARRRWWVLGTWIGGLIAIALIGQALGGEPNNSVSVPGLPAADGATILQRAFPSQGATDGQVVVHSNTGPVTAGHPRAAMIEGARRLRQVPGVLTVTAPGTPGTVSPDGRTALITIEWSTPPQDLGTENMQRVRDAVVPLTKAGLTVAYSGSPAMQAEAAQPDYSAAIGILAAMVILLIAFGSVVTMAIPVLGAIVAVGTAVCILIVLEAFTDISTVGVSIAVMIGLGVSVDYALFVLTRHGQQMAEGMDVEDSVALSVATAGRAVMIAGGTVAIAVLGLAVAQIPLVTRMGETAALAVVVAVLAALTLLPAALAIAGRGVDRWRIPFVKRPGPVSLAGPDGRPQGWARWSLMVTGRPWPFLVGALIVLIGLALPVLSLELGQVDSGSDPPGSTTREAFGLVSKGFGPGFNGPVQVVLDGPHAPEAAAAVAQRARDLADVAEVAPPQMSKTESVALVTIVPSTAPASQPTTNLIQNLSERLQPVAGAGTAVYVTGVTALGADLADRVQSRLPWFIGAVILISFILLMIEFRSLLVPLQAAIMNLLSVGAAFGVVVAVFQWGFLRSAIGVPEAVAIESWVPMMMFAILFGLSMDYEVFLLSRIREGWLRTGNSHQAVAQGLAGTARVISAAALVMVSVFLAFVVGDNVIVKMMGIGLATAVLVDATIVRLMLVPAVMILVGKGNWWLPKWIDRIVPHSHEPGAEPRESAGAPPA